jgi:hypothetical protein
MGADEIRRRLAMLTSQIRELSEAIS